MIKNCCIVILAATTTILAWLDFRFSNQKDLAEKSPSLDSLNGEIRRLAQENKSLREQARKMPTSEDSDSPLSPKQIEATGLSPHETMLAKLYGDKATYLDMVNYYKEQQRTKLAPLVSRLHLSATDEETLRNILAQDEGDRLENGYISKMNGVNGMDSPVLADLDAQLRDNLIKLLGTDGAALVAKIRKVPLIGDAALATATMTSAIGEPLTDSQFDTILELLPPPNILPKTVRLKFDDPASADIYIKAREAANQQVIAKVSGILSANQIAVLQTQLNDINARMRFYIDADIWRKRQ